MLYFVKCLKLGIFVFVTTIVVFFTISIISYNDLDPSIFNAKTDLEVHNFFGRYGASVADPIIQIIGYSIALPMLFFLLSSIKLLNGVQNRFFVYRIVALFFTTIIFTIVLAFIPKCFVTNYIGCGGVTGDYLKQLLLVYVAEDILFTTVILLFILLVIFCLGLAVKEWKLIYHYIYISIKLLINCIKYLIAKLSNQKKRLNPDYDINKISDSVDLSEEVNIKDYENKKVNPEQKFIFPNINILNKAGTSKNIKNLLKEPDFNENKESLKKVLEDYGIRGKIIGYSVGPVVTLYELEPVAGTKASRVIGLSDDISRSMSALSTRIAVMPGKNALGIEIPNEQREIIYLRELIESQEYQNSSFKLPLILGKAISGKSVVTDLTKMPHLLVAGTTGSGKSVAINTMIISLLYSCTPKQCRFVMVDPKMLELSVYNSIPHLLSPVVTEAKKAVSALKWVVQEMERRYRAMASLGVRNILGFNELLENAAKKGTTLKKVIQTGFDLETGQPKYDEVDLGSEALPYIVVVVDEMADLMLVAGKEIEGYIQRIAQMARASGIHLIMATQRPSVDVITGVIKANFPTRISFHVTSKIDSRTILGEQGAEQLLGMGDMLYMTPGGSIKRVHGPFVSDAEVENVVKELSKNDKANYDIDFNTLQISEDLVKGDDINSSLKGEEELYNQAVRIVLEEERPTTSYLQRRFKIGYNKAALLIEKMEENGIISRPNAQGKREIIQ